MKRRVSGKIQKLSNENIRELNKIPNADILNELEANSKLKDFLREFKQHLQTNSKVSNAKELRVFTKIFKAAGHHLPIPAKQLKTKTVLYLRTLQSL